MARRELPPEEIRRRLIRLRNLEVLHEQQRFKIWHLREENRQLKKEVKALTLVVSEQQRTIDDLKLQIEELRHIVFGKKRDNSNDDTNIPTVFGQESKQRTRESYQRRMPREDEITETREYPLETCAQCGGSFAEREARMYMEEDIPLPQQKIVIRHVVEKGYCTRCGTWSSAIPLPTASVVLGANVKRYVAYVSIICRQSYAQIQDLLKQTYDFEISQGELARILRQEGEQLRPEYERMKVTIRGEPSVHLDETSWHLFIGDGFHRYAWTMVGGQSSEAVFELGKTRGKGNVENLLGDSKAVVISDDYAAYRNLQNPHQLCCAHILRKLRDLAGSSEIIGAIHNHCAQAYTTFAAIYRAIETARASSDPASSYDTLLARLRQFTLPHPCDPTKLARIKEQVAQRTERYLTCLRSPHVAADNNAAERSLRHLVLKRKISFGSMSERTAETLAILCSVLLAYKQRGTLRGYLTGV
jgi:transposase